MCCIIEYKEQSTWNYTTYSPSEDDLNVLNDQKLNPTVSHRKLVLDGASFQGYPHNVEFDHYEATIVCDGMVIATGVAVIEGEPEGLIDIRVWGGGTSPELANIHFAHEIMQVLKECGMPVYRAIVMPQEGGTARIPVDDKADRSNSSQKYNIPDPERLLAKLSEVISEIAINKEGRIEFTFGYSCGAVGAQANASENSATFSLDGVGGIPWEGIQSLEKSFASSALIAVMHEWRKATGLRESLEIFSPSHISKIMTSAWVTPHGNPKFLEMVGLLISKNPPAAAQSAKRLSWPEQAVKRILTREPNADYIGAGDPAIIQRLNDNNVDINATVATRGMSSFKFRIFEALGLKPTEIERKLRQEANADRYILNNNASRVTTALLGKATTTVILDQSHFSPMTETRRTVIELLLEKVRLGFFDTHTRVRDKIVEAAKTIGRTI